MTRIHKLSEDMLGHCMFFCKGEQNKALTMENMQKILQKCGVSGFDSAG